MGSNNVTKVVAVILVALGLLAVIYGGFWYTTEETQAELGPIKIEVEQRRRVNVPLWAGVAAVAVGTALLVFRRNR